MCAPSMAAPAFLDTSVNKSPARARNLLEMSCIYLALTYYGMLCPGLMWIIVTWMVGVEGPDCSASGGLTRSRLLVKLPLQV